MVSISDSLNVYLWIMLTAKHPMHLFSVQDFYHSLLFSLGEGQLLVRGI